MATKKKKKAPPLLYENNVVKELNAKQLHEAWKRRVRDEKKTATAVLNTVTDPLKAIEVILKDDRVSACSIALCKGARGRNKWEAEIQLRDFGGAEDVGKTAIDALKNAWARVCDSFDDGEEE